MQENESYQPGGTITFATKKMATLAHRQAFIDTTGLGRWSGLHFRGKENRIFTTITAYRVCTGSIQSVPIRSSFAREYEYFKAQGIASPRPRKIFRLYDLAQVITSFQSTGHSIMLMMDSNGQISDDEDLKLFMSECDLADLHSHSPSPSTYWIRPPKNRSYARMSTSCRLAARIRIPVVHHAAGLRPAVDYPLVLDLNPKEHSPLLGPWASRHPTERATILGSKAEHRRRCPSH